MFAVNRADEIQTLITKRNQPMLTALQYCIEQLEQLPPGDPDRDTALRCARKAVELERSFRPSRG